MAYNYQGNKANYSIVKSKNIAIVELIIRSSPKRGIQKQLKSGWNFRALLVSLLFENSMITADFEFTVSSKNKEILVIEGQELYVKRKK